MDETAQDWFEPAHDGGALVPAAALDPDHVFNPACTDALIDRFLRGLEPARNEFLATPQEMADLDFEGVPYRYPPLNSGSPR